MSTESSDEFNTHHRYDSDSSLDLALMPPSKIFRCSLPQQSGTSLLATDYHVTGSQNTENTQLVTEGHSRSTESHSRSNYTTDKGNKTAACRQGHTRSQGIQTDSELVAGGHVRSSEGHSVSVEGHSRSIVGRCVNCGCESLTTVTNSADTTATSHKTDSELDEKQGSAATRGSRCGGRDWSGMFNTQSYSGAVSRELCQQLVQLLTELDSTRHHNSEVS